MEEKIFEIKKWLGSGSLNVFGMPFAGKDTQGAIITGLLDGELVSGGDVLRHYHDQSRLRELLSTGKLIPTDVYFEVVLPYIAQEKLTSKPLILSSVGRMNGEQETILKATEQSGHPTKGVIMLNLSEEKVWERFEESRKLKDRGDRDDDDTEVLKVRLQEFLEKTKPVIDFYDKHGVLIEVDGSGTREETTNFIIESLHHRAAGNKN